MTKMMKKFFAVLLAAVMTLSLSANAFALNETYTITINNDTAGYTYEAYQIFAGDLNGSTLSNIKWGSGITADGKTKLGDAAEYADTITDTNATDIADALAGYLGTAAATVTAPDANGKYVMSGLEAGYYLVKNTAVPTEDAAYTDYILEVVKDVTVDPKADIPSVTKKIVENKTEVTTNEAAIGDTVNYHIVGTLPSTLSTYNTYFYQFTDTLSKGLTYNNDMKITVNGKDVTTYFYKNATEYSATAGTTITVAIQDILALGNVTGVGDITKDSKIDITYSAKLNTNANVGATSNDNDVKLTYYNNPNDSGTGRTTDVPPEDPKKPEPTHPTGDTPKSTVSTYTTAITILKTDEKGNILTGAEFQLVGEDANIVIVTGDCYVEDTNGTYYKLVDGTYTDTAPTTDNESDYASTTTKYKKETTVTLENQGANKVDVRAFVNSEGKVTFTGLGVGTYTLKEVTTPKGYNTAKDVEFTVSFNATEKTFSASTAKDTDTVKIVTVGTDNTLQTTVVNTDGTVLPSTGGMGTTIFYIVGGVLVIGAAVLFVTKRRMAIKG